MDRQFVCSTHSYCSTDAADLQFSVGEVIEVKQWINEDWIEGLLNNKQGIFPANHVQSIHVPNIPENCYLLAVTCDIVGNNEGELKIDKGAVVIGLDLVERGNTWLCRYNNQRGKIPASNVRILLIPEELYSDENSYDHEKTAPEAVSESINPPENGVKAQVVETIVGQIDEELSLNSGDIVYITKIVDEIFCEGFCNGATGIFPLHVVNIIDATQFEELKAASIISDNNNDKLVEKVDHQETVHSIPDYQEPIVTEDYSQSFNSAPVVPATNFCFVQIKETFIAEFDMELSVIEGDSVKILGQLSDKWLWCEVQGFFGKLRGLVPASVMGAESYNKPPEFVERSFLNQLDLMVGAYVQLQFNSPGVTEQELSCCKGEVLVVKQLVDSNWIYLRNNHDEEGLVPISYLFSEVSTQCKSDMPVYARPVNGHMPSDSAYFIDKFKKQLQDLTVEGQKYFLNYENGDNLEKLWKVNSEMLYVKRCLQQLAKSQGARNRQSRSSVTAIPQPQSNITITKEPVPRKRPESAGAKLSKQDHIIKELIDTETSYLVDMQHLNTALKSSSQDINGLYEALACNLDDIIDVSKKLLQLLKEAVDNGDSIGNCFVDLKDSLLHAYVSYCVSHDNSLRILERNKYRSVCLDRFVPLFLNSLSQLRGGQTVLSVQSFLIKPVQRVLKYPLLLGDLLKTVTPEDSDSQILSSAVATTKEIANMINEQKRGKELVDKYLYPQERVARISLTRTLDKKAKRISQMWGEKIGLSEKTVDEDFDEAEKSFSTCKNCVKSFTNKLMLFCQTVQESIDQHVSLAKSLLDLAPEAPGAAAYEMVCFRTSSQYRDRFRNALENQVLLPLQKLRAAYAGPKKLIKKRYDKLLDYDKRRNDYRRSDPSDENAVRELEELTLAEKTYKALNSQLKDELPRLTTLSWELLNECLAALVHLQQRYSEASLQEFGPLLGFIESGGIMEMFEREHSERFSELVNCLKIVIPKGYKEIASASGKSVLSSKSKSLSKNVTELKTSSISRPRNSDSTGSDNMNQVNLLVSLSNSPPASPKSPRNVAGDSTTLRQTTWYLDDDWTKFLSVLESEQTAHVADRHRQQQQQQQQSQQQHLYQSQQQQQYQEQQQRLLQQQQRASYSNYSNQQFAHQQQQQEQQQQQQQQPKMSTGDQQYQQRVVPGYPHTSGCYRAMYPYSARTANELSIQAGDLVRVLEFQDHLGNSEWWLVKPVQSDISPGFLPANYLASV